MKLAIIAGGKGTRLGLNDIPKSMVRIGGKPLLEHQIRNAKHYGIKDIYILSGHLQNVIKDYFGNGHAYDVKITYIEEKYPLGTAGAIRQLEGIIDERFMVFYGDVIFDLDLASFMEFDGVSSSVATILVHPNDHPFDSDLLDINDDNIVVDFHPKPHNENTYYRNLVNAAVYILDPIINKYIPKDKPSDFGKDIFPLLVQAGEKIVAYNTAEYIKEPLKD
jgi:NDP-sugar pyrophosphorylase family protein